MVFSQALEQMMAISNSENAPEQGDYKGEDGLWYCGKCNTPKQAYIPFGDKLILQFVACECKEQAYREEKERQRKARIADHIDELRRRGIADAERRTWTFDKDDGSQPKMQIARRYVKNWEHNKANNIGLMFYGGVGTGKSFAACCIANALIDKGVSVFVTSLPKLISAMQEGQEVLNDIAWADLVVLDDVGTERTTSFADEKVFEVIDTRINTGKPLIVTTNLPESYFASKDIQRLRIVDRLLGACVEVKFDGVSHRRKDSNKKYAEAKKLLGI